MHYVQQEPGKGNKKIHHVTNSEGSKIAVFLPARQLWTWAGKGFKRSAGRAKKQFFKAIQRGKETISVSSHDSNRTLP